jgi:hypothetical protein
MSYETKEDIVEILRWAEDELHIVVNSFQNAWLNQESVDKSRSTKMLSLSNELDTALTNIENYRKVLESSED